ncbi:hypothetical protein KL928_004993 [Ogataea angusta]|uniref:Uncharacterized protein n=1 Tax=Pichia angusta TaxID=870730 RepID=A0AAN6DAU0_PICAN|nr:uncharacterized protein KL928_004993 [Ogataea angusta]KAG7816027.1 hypothetical protein KL928_004993 [Ogataea angusta]
MFRVSVYDVSRAPDAAAQARACVRSLAALAAVHEVAEIAVLADSLESVRVAVAELDRHGWGALVRRCRILGTRGVRKNKLLLETAPALPDKRPLLVLDQHVFFPDALLFPEHDDALVVGPAEHAAVVNSVVLRVDVVADKGPHGAEVRGHERDCAEQVEPVGHGRLGLRVGHGEIVHVEGVFVAEHGELGVVGRELDGGDGGAVEAAAQLEAQRAFGGVVDADDGACLGRGRDEVARVGDGETLDLGLVGLDDGDEVAVAVRGRDVDELDLANSAAGEREEAGLLVDTELCHAGVVVASLVLGEQLGLGLERVDEDLVFQHHDDQNARQQHVQDRTHELQHDGRLLLEIVPDAQLVDGEPRLAAAADERDVVGAVQHGDQPDAAVRAEGAFHAQLHRVGVVHLEPGLVAHGKTRLVLVERGVEHGRLVRARGFDRPVCVHEDKIVK